MGRCESDAHWQSKCISWVLTQRRRDAKAQRERKYFVQGISFLKIIFKAVDDSFPTHNDFRHAKIDEDTQLNTRLAQISE